MKNTFLTLFACVLVQAISAQYYNKLSKTDDSNNNFESRGGIRTSDGGSVVVGGLYAGTNQNSQSQVLVKYNSTGDTLWTKTFSYDTAAYFQDVAESANGDLLIVGSVYDAIEQKGGYASVVRLDPNGNYLWSKKIGYINGSLFNLTHSSKPKLEVIGNRQNISCSIWILMN